MRSKAWHPTFVEIEWATRFAMALRRLGATDGFEELLDEGMKLWKTMGQMMPEDVAEFEQRWMVKDTRVFESVTDSRQTLWGSIQSLFADIEPAASSRTSAL